MSDTIRAATPRHACRRGPTSGTKATITPMVLANKADTLMNVGCFTRSQNAHVSTTAMPVINAQLAMIMTKRFTSRCRRENETSAIVGQSEGGRSGVESVGRRATRTTRPRGGAHVCVCAYLQGGEAAAGVAGGRLRGDLRQLVVGPRRDNHALHARDRTGARRLEGCLHVT